MQPQINRDDYQLSLVKPTKFNELGVKVVDESKDELLLIKSTSQRMFFNKKIAIQLLKDLAFILADEKKEEKKNK